MLLCCGANKKERTMELKQLKIETKIGPLFLVASQQGLCRVLWKEQDVAFASQEDLKNSPEGVFLHNARTQISEYLEGKRKEFSLPLDLHGTDFQLKVWRHLLKIPYGETRSYKEIAQALNSPEASRAVGTANGKNPVSLIVPCHRVINSDGGLGGYAGGLPIKTTLLQLEITHSE